MDRIDHVLQSRAAAIRALREHLDACETRGEFTAEDQSEVVKREAEIARLDATLNALRMEATLSDNGTDAEVGQRAQGGQPDTRSVEEWATAYAQAFDSYLRRGIGGLSVDERAAIQAGFEREDLRDLSVRDLNVGTAANGGYTVPVDFLKELQVFQLQAGFVESLSRVFRTGDGGDLHLPQVTAHGAATWTGEAVAFTAADETFAEIILKAYKAGRLVKVSTELLEDSMFDLSSYLAEELGRSIGQLQNTAYVVGNGTAKPTGFTTNATVGKTGLVGQTTTVIADDLFDTFHSLAVPYRANAVWVMHDSTIKAIRKLKDSQNRYLWQASIQDGAPDTLLSKPVYADPDSPTMVANAKSIAFGDFRRGYAIRRVNGVKLVRLNERYMDAGQVGFIAWDRVDGKLYDANAIRQYQNSAT
jgi:HK97 family phage major capsid protein